jgi:hypothetical protein
VTEEYAGYARLDEIATVYATTPAYAKRLAHRDRWRRYKHPDGTTRYWRLDVETSLAPGAATRRARLVDRRSSAG